MENNTDGASDENDEKMKNLDISEKEDNRRLVPAKFVYILVRMRYFLAGKYKHKLRGESVWKKNSTQCLTVAVQ